MARSRSRERRRRSRSRRGDDRHRRHERVSTPPRKHDRRRNAVRSRRRRSSPRYGRRRQTSPSAHRHREQRRWVKHRSPTPYSSSTVSASASSGSESKKQSADSDKDEIVHFKYFKGQLLGDMQKLGSSSRYEVLKLLGDGTFGRVLLCKDKMTKKEVAVKVIRDVKRYAENAKIEADILDDIKAADPLGRKTRSAILHTHFTFNRHFCLVFDVCGVSLYDFLKENNFRGFWLKDIQHIAEQSMEALGFLHTRLQMTHTDLKPENILLAVTEAPTTCEFPREAAWQEKNKASGKKNGHKYLRPRSSEIKLIDFGNATYDDEHHSSIINTRQYRGPEVILSLGWNDRSDVWSMGCILMELYTGELLFGTHDNLEHMALMERSLGRIPPKMLAASPTAAREKYLMRDRYGELRLNWPAGAQTPSSERHVRNQMPLDQMVSPQHQSFASFVGHLLTFEKGSRPSSMEALSHSFLKERDIAE